MNVSTALNKQKRALSQLGDLYRIARISRPTSSEISRRFVSEILDGTLSKTPQWVRYYIKGYRDCLDRALWPEMEFCYKVDGRWYTTSHDTDKPRWDTLPPEKFDMSGRPCGYFWRNTEKPFTDISPAGDHTTQEAHAND